MSVRTCLYIFHYSLAENDYFKCGIACDLDRRISQLQTGNPHEIGFVHAISCPTVKVARALEVDVHRYLAAYKLMGEWFCCSHSDIIEAVHAAFYVNQNLTGIRSLKMVMDLLMPQQDAA